MAQNGEAFRALDCRFGQARSAQDVEVMGAGGLVDFEGDLIAGEGTARLAEEMPDDLEPAGVGERLHDVGQGDAAHGGVTVFLHLLKSVTYFHSSTMIELTI